MAIQANIDFSLKSVIETKVKFNFFFMKRSHLIIFTVSSSCLLRTKTYSATVKLNTFLISRCIKQT